MRTLKPIAFGLLIIGGLNWGLVGLGAFMGSNWNLVNFLFGQWPSLEWLVYILVGLAAVWILFKKVGRSR